MKATTDPTIRLLDHAPSTEVFIAMRAQCGWGMIDPNTARTALAHDLFSCTLYQGDRVMGFGRVVGDGALYYYLQDVIIAPDQGGQGLGRMIVERLMTRIRSQAASGSSIGLMAAVGTEPFYRHFGFRARPSAKKGAGMSLMI